jgi:TolB-like protein
LRLEPLHEPAVRRLMRLYGESGRRGPAIQLYRALADALKTELGAQPEAETRAVYAELARGGEERTSASPAQGAPVAPAAPAAADAKAPLNLSPPSNSAHEWPPSVQQRPPADGAPRKVAPASAQTRTLNWVLAGGLAAVAMAIFFFYQFALTAGTTTARQSSHAEVISIAVLPFVNLSGDAGQEFFSDGITEEITSALAKVPDLRVVGRTSAFQFKGQSEDLRAIGQSLAATHLIEGSVRKVGDHLRITVQLIKAEDGTHIWAEDYDRQLTDIFAVQEDIARAITTSLRVPLGLKQGDTLVNNRSINPESYQQYLRARALMQNLQNGGRSRLAETVALLEQVVARNPEYAPAWAELAHAYFWTITFSPERATGSLDEFHRLVDDQLSKSEAAAKRAVQLDPNLAAGYLWLGPASLERGNILEAFELGSKALALDPNNPDILGWHSDNLAIVGRVKESNAMKLQELALEPFVPVSNTWAASYL